uniref:3-ketoacyl-CoA thiolase B, peroxisomal-like n=2 Tax=Sinocyclocheilus grahami TaxID=75366 RepID=A0A672LA49_SINGR
MLVEFDVRGQQGMNFSLEEALLWILARTSGLKLKRLHDEIVYYKRTAFRFARHSLMDWSRVDYLYSIVMFLSADSFILTAPIHCRGSTCEQVTVESMSLRSPNNPGDISPRLMDNEKARDCIIPMGITSENVAERFGITREKQDRFALSSQQKAAMAQKKGLFEQEITPVTTKFVDENGTERTITVTKDDGIRPGTTLEGLAKLRPAFKETGSTTAGNASQVSDGAAAVLIGRRSTVEKLGLPVFGVLRACAVVGVPPDVMGIGPAYAIPEALNQAGLTVDDIDVFEINEAFASQAVYCVEKLGIPMEKVNPNGGAIALGHPLGCTGARQVVTVLNELKRRRKRGYGVVSMCIGTGMGAAAVFEYPGQ